MIRIPFFKPRENPIAALYGDIVAASRAPEAYRSFGVTDDFESRFERLVLVMTLALRVAELAPDRKESVLSLALGLGALI